MPYPSYSTAYAGITGAEAEWQIFVRDSNRNRIVEVDDFTSLATTLRFNDTGSWILQVPADSRAADVLAFGAGIVVTRDSTVLISGPIARLERSWTGTQDNLVASGPDDLKWLERRLTYPVPTGPPYTAAAYDVRTGVAETVIRQYVDVNAGPTAVVARRIPGLTLAADQARGSTVTGRGRFQTLLELAQSLALAGGDLGFRVAQSGTNLELQFYVPTDRTDSVIFSPELGNLSEFNYVAAVAEANYILAAGGGEGTARVFREAGDAASISAYGRIESFRDRRDTTDTAELDQTITEELAALAEQTGISISPVDTEALSFITDYNLGDRVTVVVDGSAIEEVVREVRLTLSPERGEVIEPIVGTPGRSSILGLFDKVRQVGSRVSHLERR